MENSLEFATISSRTRLKHKQPEEREYGVLSVSQQAPARPASVEDVKMKLGAAFPGRSRQIKEVLDLLGGPNDAVPPLLIFGSSATGKTAVLRGILQLLCRPHAYVSCRSCHSPRLLFESVINQLAGHVRSSAHGYASHRRCDKMTDFIAAVPDVCRAAIQRAKKAAKQPDQIRAPAGHGKEGATAGGSAGGAKATDDKEGGITVRDEPAEASLAGGSLTGSTVYIVFDNVELLRDWSGGDSLISALLRLPELIGLASMGVILISKVGWDAFRSSTGSREPLAVHFPDYSDEELFKVLQQQHPEDPLYATFIKSVMPVFSRTCRCATELREAFEPLYARYREPLDNGTVSAEEGNQLWKLIQPHIRPSLLDTLHISTTESEAGSSAVPSSSRSTERKRALDFELSRCGKLLLLSAYVCSRNPATLDSSIFETGGDNVVKRKRKASALAIEKQEMQLQEEHLKGPGTFPLERLLAIFRALLDADSDKAMAGDEPEGGEITADVLMQLSTLVATNLLMRMGGDPLDSGVRFRCSADETLANKVAKSMDFPLHKYVLHG